MHKYDPTKVGVVRYKTHGHRFELVCSRAEYAALVERLEGGKVSLPLETDLMKRVVLSSTVFSNAHKWEASTKSSRAAAFGDAEASSHMYSSILIKGEMLASEQERNDRFSRQQDTDMQVNSLVRLMLRNIYTGVEPEVDDTNQAIQTVKKACHIKVSAAIPAITQAGAIAAMVAEKLDSVRIPLKIVVGHSSAHSGKWDVFLHDFGTVALSLQRSVVGDSIEQLILADVQLVKDNAWTALVEATGATLHTEDASADEVKLYTRQQYDMPTQPDVPEVAHAAPLIKKLKVVEEKSNSVLPNESKWATMPHKALQLECKKRGLSTGGSKAVLVDRIESHDE